MADTYRNFSELSAKHSRDRDFRIIIKAPAAARVLVIAPHAGKIETGTSELAQKIAGHDCGLYLFEGLMQNGNSNLHITSHKFDEPLALEVLRRHQLAVGIHGRKDKVRICGEEINDTATTLLGGLDDTLKEYLNDELSGAGFVVRTDGHKFPATDPMNVCNRGANGCGSQLELPLTLRNELLRDDSRMEGFSGAVRRAIANRVTTL